MVTHQRRSYAYDLMGNRQSASQGTSEEELVPTGYHANILQQYDGINHTRKVEISGQAVAGRQVRLSLDGGTDITVDRNDPAHQTGDPNSFRYLHPVSGTGARWLHVKVTAGTPADVVSVRQGFVYVPPAAESLGYDLDGNLTNDGQWTYLWDAENRLIDAEQKELPVAVNGTGSPPPTRKRLKFAYDHNHRRISKKVFEWRFDPVDSTWKWFLTKDLRFVYDGWQMIAELDHSFVSSTSLSGSAVNRTFLWGPDLSGSMTGAGGVGGLLSTTYQGVTYQVCSDANGNVTGLVPVSGTGAGTLVARFDYDPFGNRVTNAGPNVELCPFGFSSKYLDAESGIVNYELRGYLPQSGRWPSRDPIAERGGINLYGMVGNDPVNHWDYLGLADILVEMTRTYYQWDTVSEFTAKATSQSIASCCKEVKGQTIELKQGKYSLVPDKRYRGGDIDYPIPAGNHSGNWSPSEATSIQGIVNSINEGILQSHAASERAYWAAMENASQPNFIQRLFGVMQNGPTLPGEGSLYEVPDGELGTNNILIIAGGGFSGTRMHIGQNCNWSRGCPILGRNAQLQDTQITIYQGHVGETVKLHNFNIDDSYAVAKELGALVLCVKKQLKNATSSIEVRIK